MTITKYKLNEHDKVTDCWDMQDQSFNPLWVKLPIPCAQAFSALGP